MRATHYIVGSEKILGAIYDHEQYGKVIVFWEKEISIDDSITVMTSDSLVSTPQEHVVDMLTLVLDVLPPQ